MGEPQTYFLETLGCPKNQVDSDKLLRRIDDKMYGFLMDETS